MRHVARIARSLTLFVLLGAATSVGVAWGLALRLPRVMEYGRDVVVHDGEQFALNSYVVNEVGSFGLVRRGVHVERIIAFPTSHPIESWPVRSSRPRRFGLVPSSEIADWGVVAQIARRPIEREYGAAFGTDDARGWPALALWCAHEWREEGPQSSGALQPVIVGGVRLGARPSPGAASVEDPARFRALPFMPIWRGLAINTAFYAMAWAGLVFGFTGLRTLTRRHRGRCTRCGYDLRGDLTTGCPECGWRRGLDAPSTKSPEAPER